ncbi:hypothetical protein GCM10009574_073890 [Streptomyces asiaticus]|uniref:Uncharacterized protein n=1 Tax=Streptomyces rhizosphaericus TaxID=114699 RepID=A0ABN1S6A4_9ACTN
MHSAGALLEKDVVIGLGGEPHAADAVPGGLLRQRMQMQRTSPLGGQFLAQSIDSEGVWHTELVQGRLATLL